MIKKLVILLISIIVISALILCMSGCSFLSIIDSPDNKPKNNEDEKEGDEEDEDEDGNTKSNPYLDTINYILGNISDIDSLDDFVTALSFLLNNTDINAIFNIKEKAKTVIPDEYHEIVDTYFEQGAEMLELAATIVPFLPYIDILLPLLTENDGLVLNTLLKKAGINKDGDTYTFTKNEVEYTVQIQETDTEQYLFLVSFDDTELTIEYFSSNHIKATENNIQYEISFEPENTSLLFNATDVTDAENPLLKYTFECIDIDNDFAFQFFNKDGASLIQIKTEIQKLEASVSIQNEIDELPYSIIEQVPANFATEGNIYTINDGLLDEYLPENN